jgi:hypothetical protein
LHSNGEAEGEWSDNGEQLSADHGKKVQLQGRNSISALISLSAIHLIPIHLRAHNNDDDDHLIPLPFIHPLSTEKILHSLSRTQNENKKLFSAGLCFLFVNLNGRTQRGSGGRRRKEQKKFLFSVQ